MESEQTSPALGLLASAVAGLGAVLITITSKLLLSRDWKFGAVLAHRFYVIVPVALILALGSDVSDINWSMLLMSTVVFVSAVGVLVPLYLLQVGISRCNPYTVMVTLAALPVLTFAIEGFSSRYEWTFATAIGLAIITGALLWDAMARRKWLGVR